MSEIPLLVVDDHEVVRQGVRAVLTQYVGWEVCGEAVDGEDAIAKAKFLLPDVIILDTRMPRLGGLEAAKAIKTQLPKTKILFLTQHDAAAMLPLACDEWFLRYQFRYLSTPHFRCPRNSRQCPPLCADNAGQKLPKLAMF